MKGKIVILNNFLLLSDGATRKDVIPGTYCRLNDRFGKVERDDEGWWFAPHSIYGRRTKLRLGMTLELYLRY